MLNKISESVKVVVDGIGSANPIYILVAIAVLPLFGFPVSPLMVIAGVRLGALYGFWLVFLGLLFNFSAAYWLSAKMLREWLIDRIRRRGLSIPCVSLENMLAVTILIRATPGIPLFIQNYVLGVAGVRFWTYIIVSMLVHSIYGLAFVVFGNALTESKVWRMLIGGGLFVSIVLALSIVRRNLAKRRKLQRPVGHGES
jgi:uncharacterized membrane protein YdjX (TVP38/TMEM64 family)